MRHPKNPCWASSQPSNWERLLLWHVLSAAEFPVSKSLYCDLGFDVFPRWCFSSWILQLLPIYLPLQSRVILCSQLTEIPHVFSGPPVNRGWISSHEGCWLSYVGENCAISFTYSWTWPPGDSGQDPAPKIQLEAIWSLTLKDSPDHLETVRAATVHQICHWK